MRICISIGHWEFMFMRNSRKKNNAKATINCFAEPRPTRAVTNVLPNTLICHNLYKLIQLTEISPQK